MNPAPLTERERVVLEAVIRTYVETAEPAGSRTVAGRFGLGISPATVRNTMSDLEEKGYLFHPHTSAGRVPTDRAYRLYVNALLERPRRSPLAVASLRSALEASGDRSATEALVRHAAQALGLLTQELGVATAPRLDDAVLERLELLRFGEGKLLLVLALRAGGVRTIYVDVPLDVPAASLQSVTQLLNERLAGHTLSEIRATLPERLRDSAPIDDVPATELLNVFVQSADGWFEPVVGPGSLHLGRTSVLAEQPEFSSGAQLRSLIELTEQRELLNDILGERTGESGLHITIGAEHGNEALSGFTMVTSEYCFGKLRGVIGVIGPTRMPYDRVIALVESTSMLVSEFLA